MTNTRKLSHKIYHTVVNETLKNDGYYFNLIYGLSVFVYDFAICYDEYDKQADFG